MDKKDFKISFKLFIYMLVCVFIGALLYATVESVSIVLFTNQKGVNIFSTAEDGTINQRLYYFKENETVDDVELAEGEVIGQHLNTEMAAPVKAVVGVVEQLGLFILFFFANDLVIKAKSRKHRYAHELNGAPFDKYKGFKWGLFASIPFALSYILLVFGKIFNSNSILNIYKTFNWQTLPLYKLICWGNQTEIANIGWISIILLVVCWAVLPCITQLSFMLGVNDGKLYKKIVYENKR